MTNETKTIEIARQIPLIVTIINFNIQENLVEAKVSKISGDLFLPKSLTTIASSLYITRLLN